MTEVERNAAVGDRELIVSRVIGAPARLAFKAWTEVRHLSRWFGPDGFMTTTREFAFRPGGVWEFTMHGPDGVDYPNRIEWREISPPDRISYWHGTEAGDPEAFQTTVTFVERDGSTEITLYSVFATRERRDEVVERFGAIEGGIQTIGRLGEYVATFDAAEVDA
jgi:uncharacterized protein YndB with AHSA1/START domain